FRKMLPVLVICVSSSFAVHAAPGLRAARLEAMSGAAAGPVAPLAAVTTAGVPAPDSAHFTVPFVLPGDFTSAFDINDHGVIVGSLSSGDTSSALVFRDGAEIVFDPPGAAGFSELGGVNSRGDAVGDYVDASGIDRGFLRSADGTIVDLPDPVPNFRINLASGINAHGAIVGAFTTGPDFRSGCVGYLLRDGRYQTIDIPGATCVFGNGINDHGDIVGNWIDANRFAHGFLIRGGDRDHVARRQIVDLTIPGLRTVPLRMNERGEIVGDYAILVGRVLDIHGFVRRDDEVRTLDDPAGIDFSFLAGVTNGGVIVGSSSNGGYLAIPVSQRPAHEH
ncbi:MAG: hypothetical protein ACJ787_13380, partial [Myxococcales bacterium]